jgi:hypothetical protein
MDLYYKSRAAEHANPLRFSLRNVLAVFLLSVTAAPLRAQDAGIAIAWNDVATNNGMLGLISASDPWPALHTPISAKRR